MNYKSIMIVLGAAALLLATGCDEEKYKLKFSHYLHVEDMGIECSDCHGETGTEGFNAISHETCIDCHDEVEAEEITAETCGYCHQEKQVPLLENWEAEPEALPRNLFVHTEALAENCSDCHGGLMDEDLSSVPMLSRNDVISMREEAHASGRDCNDCHVDMDKNRAPLSHDLAWERRHGQFGMMNDASCSVCHTEDSCKDCHSVMQPRSHNNLWRLRAHGAVASWDRASCATCHEEDSCVSCHSQVAPRSHNARWEENHCYGCHTTSANDGCVVCHEEGGNVLLHQGFWPPVHDLFGNQANCYDCHNPFED